MKYIFLFLLLFPALGAAETFEIKSASAVVPAGESVELYVEGKDGLKFVWDDGGAGGVFEGASSKVKWNAPALPGSKNPATITATCRDAGGAVTGWGTKQFFVLGGAFRSDIILNYCDGPGPAKFFKAAANQPEGTRYKWVMAKGDDLAFHPEDLNKPEVRVKARRSSRAENTNEAVLLYSLTSGTETKTVSSAKKITVLQPFSLKEMKRDLKQEFGPDVYGYALTIIYQVMDQFNKPLPAEGIHVEEGLKMVKNPMRVPPEDFNFKMEGFNTDYDGRFTFGMKVSKSAPIPDGFQVSLVQDFRIRTGDKDVPGSIVRRNELDYGKDNGNVREIKEKSDIQGVK